MKSLFLAIAILFQLNVLAEDSPTASVEQLQEQLNLLKMRVGAIENRLNSDGPWLCAATCKLWWENGAPSEFYDRHATGTTRLKAYEALEGACQQIMNQKNYKKAKWYLKNPKAEQSALVTDNSICIPN